jgi:CelD/BcsL family acetyltransferase involved in cellulose biosynthesis
MAQIVALRMNPTAYRIIFSLEPRVDLDILSAMWRELEARADCSFFLSWQWIGCWLRETGLTPTLVTGSLDGRVVALALLVARRVWRHRWVHADTIFLHETGDPALDINFIEYNGILVDRTLGAAAIERCLEFLIGTPVLEGGSAAWDELYLGGVPIDYIESLERCGLRLRVAARKPTTAVDFAGLRGNRRAYLDELSANTRYQIRRSMRLYERRGPLRLDVAGDTAQALAFLDDLKVLHQRRWEPRGKGGAFSYPFLERFHRSLIARGLPEGNAEVLRISAGEQPIGYLYNFIWRGWVGTYLSGFAYEDDARLKPGLVSYYLCAERHLANGMAVQDFLAGGERYKTNLGKPGPDMFWLALQRPRLRFRLESALRRIKHALMVPRDERD